MELFMDESDLLRQFHIFLTNNSTLQSIIRVISAYKFLGFEYLCVLLKPFDLILVSHVLTFCPAKV